MQIRTSKDVKYSPYGWRAYIFQRRKTLAIECKKLAVNNINNKSMLKYSKDIVCLWMKNIWKTFVTQPRRAWDTSNFPSISIIYWIDGNLSVRPSALFSFIQATDHHDFCDTLKYFESKANTIENGPNRTVALPCFEKPLYEWV